MSVLDGIGIAAFTAAVSLLDRRNKKIGEFRNAQDLCARCGAPLQGHPGQLINLSGYASFAKGRACAKCYDTVRFRDRIFFPLAYAVFFVLISIWLFAEFHR